MRAIIVALAAAGFAMCSLFAHAEGEVSGSQSKADQAGRTLDSEQKLKSAGASAKAGRAIDEDAPLKTTGGGSKKQERAAQTDNESLKSAGSSTKGAHPSDDERPLKSAGG